MSEPEIKLPEFRESWDGLMHDGNWKKWLGHLRDTPAMGLEIGTFLGESAEWMLFSIFNHPDSVYCCVDTFKGSAEHHLAGVDCSTLEATARARVARFAPRAEFYVGYSNDVLAQMIHMNGKLRYDFVLIDGAHDAQNVLRDAVLAFELLKVGGIMILDDLAWSLMPDPVDCPRIAIDAFIKCYGRQVEVIGYGTQAAVKKIK